MDILFAGTPEFAAIILGALLDSEHRVTAVLTQPDRPAGRGRKISASPVKALALEHGVDVYQPGSLKDADSQALVRSLEAQVMVVVAYGLILPPPVLEIPRYGCINLHASLLPRWRGAAPIQRAIEAGDEQTGISIMQMDAGLDTGDVLVDEALAIEPGDTATSLHDKLAGLGAAMIAPMLTRLGRGELEATAQNDALATYAAKLDRNESAIDWALPARTIVNKIHAFNPWPGAKAVYKNVELKLLQAKAVDTDTRTQPGTITLDGKSIRVQSGSGQVQLLQLQKPGGKPMRAEQFLNGFKLESGQRMF